MKSKTSYFNRTLFFSLLKRFWPLFSAYLIIWLIVLPCALGNKLGYEIAQNTYNNDLRILFADAVGQVYSTAIIGGVIMSGIFSIFIAMASFSYLYNPRSVSAMCALPIKREGVFISVFTSGLLWLLVSNIVVFLAAMAVETSYGVLQIGSLLQWFAMVSMINIFFFGFSAFCATLTGHILVLPLLYVVLNFTAIVVEFLVKKIIAIFVYGASIGDSSTLMFLSPAARIITTQAAGVTEVLPDGTSVTTAYYYSNWTLLAIYALVGLAFALFAMFILKHRKMETAGDVVAIKHLKPIFKYCLSVGCALVFGVLIFWAVFNEKSNIHGVRSMMFLLVFMLFGAFVGYFAAEMLMKKTMRVFKGRGWLGFGITAALIVAFMLCNEYDVFGYERHLPTPDQVQSVQIQCSGQKAQLKEPENINNVLSLHKDIISNKNANEKCLGNDNLDNFNTIITYTLKNGNIMRREYSIYYPATNDILTLTDIMNSKEGLANRIETSIPVDAHNIMDAYISYFDIASSSNKEIELTPSQAYDLYSRCMVPDMNAGTLGKVRFVRDENYDNIVCDCSVSFTLISPDKSTKKTAEYFSADLTVNSVNTSTWIKDNFGINICTVSESQKLLQGKDVKEKVYAQKFAG